MPEGNININENEVTSENYLEYYQQISFIKKEFTKMNYLNTVKEHMDYIINYYHLQIKNIEKKEKDSLKIVGLDETLLNRNITTLSKSEKKKVELAIGLLSNPDIIILDDPFRFLDNKSRKRMIMFSGRTDKGVHAKMQ